MQYSTIPFEINWPGPGPGPGSDADRPEPPQQTAFCFELGSLLAYLGQLTDLRAKRGRLYPLLPCLAIALLAKLMGQNQVRELADWAKWRATELAEWCGLERNTMPHHTTWSRLLGQAIDPKELEQVVGQFMADQLAPQIAGRGEVVLAIDGKTLRGTIPAGAQQGVHLMAAYLPGEGVVLAQVAVEGKENEIVAAPRLLRELDLRGTVVVGDAMQAQRALSTQIVEQGGDYLWLIKGNQKGVLCDLETLFGPEPIGAGGGPMPTDFAEAEQWSKGHGRLEQRQITTSSLLKEYTPWPHLEQAFKLERWVYPLEGGAALSHEVRYGLSSLPSSVAGPARLMEVARAEWGIENGLHHRRDVQLREDHSQLRRGQGPQVNAILNNTVLGLLARSGRKRVADSRRELAAKPALALAFLAKRDLAGL